MATIEAGSSVVTHINVFTVDPARQDELVASLTETVAAAAKMPGWISASIHKSLDGRKVVNYVQFETAEAGRAVTAKLAELGFIARNTAIGTVQPGQYEVVHTLSS
jgi:hypothetical protein